MNNKFNVLITSAGQRVSLVRAFKSEVCRLDKGAKVYTVDLNPILAPACHISDGYKAVPMVNDPEYLEQLLDICIAWNIKIIVPTIDTELLVLAKHRMKFEELGITPVISSLDFVSVCRDKRLINQFFVDKGIEIPKAIDPLNPSFPLFIKPYDGSLSKDIYLIKDETEFLEHYKTNPKFMFMEYLDPVFNDEFTVDAYYDQNGNLKCAVPRARLVIRAGEINKGVTRKNELLAFVKKQLSHIEGARGCLTMQFFLNSKTKRIIGIEINPRFGGGYPLSYSAGANYPRFILEEYLLHQEVKWFDEWEEDLLMLRYDDAILVKGYE